MRPNGQATQYQIRRLVFIGLRSRFLALLAWLGGLTVLIIAVPPVYASFFDDASELQGIMGILTDSNSIGLFFGPISDPLTIGSLFQWQLGAYAMILTAVAAIVLTNGRREEDGGIRELIQTTGVPTRKLIAAQILIAIIPMVLFAALITGLLVAESLFVADFSPAGSIVMGVALLLAGLTYAAIALVLEQLLPQVPARRVALASVLLGYALRVAADATGQMWIRWITPLGWKDILAPYSKNLLGAALPMLAIVIALFVLAQQLFLHRELHGAFLQPRSASAARLRVSSSLSLTTRLARGSIVSWTAVILLLAMLFGTMSTTVLDLAETSGYGDILSAMTDSTSSTAQFVTAATMFLAIIISIAGTTLIGTATAAETAGLADIELSTGVSRIRFFGARVAVAFLTASALVFACAAVLAAGTATELDATAARQTALMSVSQLPGIYAALGIGAALYGFARRLMPLVWAAIAWSAFVSWFGGLLHLPRWVLRLSLFDYATDRDPNWAALTLLLLIAVMGITLGLALLRRRDITTA
ncbi:hypothetical protein DDD63_04825 [Actinobaculum sp. 313]|nr:hypothetical protein DDD63_04825 [Actinobaculum sp. 313]